MFITDAHGSGCLSLKTSQNEARTSRPGNLHNFADHTIATPACSGAAAGATRNDRTGAPPRVAARTTTTWKSPPMGLDYTLRVADPPAAGAVRDVPMTTPTERIRLQPIPPRDATPTQPGPLSHLQRGMCPPRSAHRATPCPPEAARAARRAHVAAQPAAPTLQRGYSRGRATVDTNRRSTT